MPDGDNVVTYGTTVGEARRPWLFRCGTARTANVGGSCQAGVMTAITTRCWTEAGTTWFAVSVVGPELAARAGHVLMDYQRDGDEWRRGYPADTPGLDACWQNFAGCAEPMLRQAAGLEPVPWRAALHELCRRTSGREAGWWLAGSTALAVRGAGIEPGDIDLVCSGDSARRLGAIFADTLIEPVAYDRNSDLSDYWGRAFPGARLEWIGDPKAGVDSPAPTDFGPVAASRLETVTWEGWQLRVPPLDLQRAVSQRRGLTTRVALIDALLRE